VFSSHDMVVAGAGEAPMPCLRGGGRLSPPFPVRSSRGEDKQVLQRGEQRAREVHVVKGEMDVVPPT
jgi:hypothetical protein